MKRFVAAAALLGLLLVSCSNPASGTLLGTWGQNGVAIWTFNSDSTFTNQTLGTGTYTYTSTTIVIVYNGGTQTQPYSYNISGNYLTLTITGKNDVPSSATFTRM